MTDRPGERLVKRSAGIILLSSCVLMSAGAGDPERRRSEAMNAAMEMGYDSQDRQREMTRQAEGVVPAYQGAAVPEAEYYDDADAMPAESVDRAAGTPGGRFVGQSYYTRRRFQLHADTDPLLLRSRDIRKSPESHVSVAGSDEGECAVRERQVGTPSFTERYCTAWNAGVRTCRQRCYCPTADEWDVSIGDDMTVTYEYPLLTVASREPDPWSGPCREHDRELVFTIADAADIADWSLTGAEWADHLRIVLNDTQVFIGPHTGDRLQALKQVARVPVTVTRTVCRPVHSGNIYQCRGSTTTRGTSSYCCERMVEETIQPRTIWLADYGVRHYDCAAGKSSDDVAVDLKPYLRVGENRLKVRALVAERGGVNLRMRLRRPCDCRQAGHVSDGLCRKLVDDSVAGRCRSTRSACLPDTPRCGHEEQEYLCLGEQLTEEGYCRELRERGCAQINVRCVDSDGSGNCLEHEQAYRCPSEPATWETVPDCGERISCLAGDCFDTSYPSSGDFPLAASHLSVVEELAADFDRDSLRVFSGEGRQCRKTLFGFSNCCRDSGWGVDLGLKRCSRPEQELGEKRRRGLCHYVGSYKKGRLFSKKRYQSFCCFDSLLGRIVQQQGREQLGRNWGSARRPDCQGFLIDDVSSLDFERFDLSEFYVEAQRRAGGVHRPDAAELGDRLRERIRRLSESGP